jgi:hypothetical protein
MAFGGGLGKKLGLGSTSDVFEFGATAAGSYFSGGAIPTSGSPFATEEPQQMFQQDPGLTAELNRMHSRTQQPVVDRGFFGDLGSTLGNFGRNVGGFFDDISPLVNLFGGGGGLSRTNSGAASTIIKQRPDETATSGEILGANLGIGGMLLNQGAKFLSRPGTQIGIGVGGGLLADAFMGGPSGKPRITRKMKADVRRIYMMAGMDPNLTAQILNNMGTYPQIRFDANTVFFILTKRFRNDGPVVTKAAVRKTKTTLRRMKGVVDMYNSVCKPTSSRRAPARRAAPKAVQLIKN